MGGGAPLFRVRYVEGGFVKEEEGVEGGRAVQGGLKLGFIGQPGPIAALSLRAGGVAFEGAFIPNHFQIGVKRDEIILLAIHEGQRVIICIKRAAGSNHDNKRVDVGSGQFPVFTNEEFGFGGVVFFAGEKDGHDRKKGEGQQKFAHVQ